MPDDQTTPKPTHPQSSEIETYTPKLTLPTEPSQELLSVLAQGLKAQIAVGDYGAIDKIIDLQATAIAQDQNLRQQEIDLANKKLDQSHELALKKEARFSAENKAAQNTTKLIVAAIALAFAGSLIAKEASLADKVFTGAMSALGGSGLVALSQRKGKDSTSKDTDSKDTDSKDTD
jgi:hypothetical protein